MAIQNMICGVIIFCVGAILYSFLIGVDYLATFWNNPFNYMLLGLGFPMILIGIGLDLGCYAGNKLKIMEVKNGRN